MSALVGVIMGSKSDWSTLCHTVEMLDKLGIPNEVKVVSAHRTPDLLFQYAEQAEGRGIQVIIAGAGGAGVRAPIFGSSSCAAFASANSRIRAKFPAYARQAGKGGNEHDRYHCRYAHPYPQRTDCEA